MSENANVEPTQQAPSKDWAKQQRSNIARILQPPTDDRLRSYARGTT